MTVPLWVWGATIAGIVALLAFDFFFHVRKAHVPTIREAATWTSIYVSIALAFGIGVWIVGGSQMGIEFLAGYITELSLSVDNLFVFLIIMSSFRVPRADQQKVLMFGIVVSLIARTGFILVGAAMINAWSWVFYFFGAILLITAWNLVKPEKEEDDSSEANNFIIRLAKRFMHTTDYYDGDKLFTMVDGRKAMTPMLLVMIAIGGTDVMFALDSIPAIFGLTQNAYIVFTAVAFSLLGLRQLYFLIDGLLDRLIYLKYGLAVILGFIGVKLILHALHENSLSFLNSGEPFHVPVITIQQSLGVIIASLLVVVAASLLSPRGKALTALSNARRNALAYLDLGFQSDIGVREKHYRNLLRNEAQVLALPAKYQPLVEADAVLLDLLDDAHRTHADYVSQNAEKFPEGDPVAHYPVLDTSAYRHEDALEGADPED